MGGVLGKEDGREELLRASSRGVRSTAGRVYSSSVARY